MRTFLLTFMSALLCGSCARSPSTDDMDIDDVRASDDAGLDPDADDDARDRDDEQEERASLDARVATPPVSSPMPTQPTAPRQNDAGTASTRDAAAAPSTPPSNNESSSPRDAGRTTTTRDAAAAPSTPAPAANRCTKSSDCKNECGVTGILNCCTERGTCGCTWAPGAYCL